MTTTQRAAEPAQPKGATGGPCVALEHCGAVLGTGGATQQFETGFNPFAALRQTPVLNSSKFAAREVVSRAGKNSDFPVPEKERLRASRGGTRNCVENTDARRAEHMGVKGIVRVLGTICNILPCILPTLRTIATEISKLHTSSAGRPHEQRLIFPQPVLRCVGTQ